MNALTRAQCWNLPNNIIQGENRRWRELVMINIPSVNKTNVDDYVKHNIPELAYQFNWEAMTDNQRLQEKFKYRNSYASLRESGHYDGYQIEVEEDE